MSGRRGVAVVGLACALSPGLVWLPIHYAGGAPPGFSGGFGEESCHACHFQAEVNGAPGKLTVIGVPERFRAGERYPLAVRLARPGMALAGFQLTARFEGAGSQAGALAPAAGEEARIAIEVHNGIQYANQRKPGATPIAPGTAEWKLLWTAPAPALPVVFHVAANAADADETASGDYVYTAVARVEPHRPRSTTHARPPTHQPGYRLPLPPFCSASRLSSTMSTLSAAWPSR